MTKTAFFNACEALGREAGSDSGHHKYFISHRERLWSTGSHFGLWDLRNQAILEVGPFFSYVPFILGDNGNRVTVIEGDDPAVKPLVPLYERRKIPFVIVDLFENFGATRLERHHLPFEENTFDVVNCWETMEHFNFNPVGFLKELLRILKPGGRAFITVPNVAKLDWRLRLLQGKPIGPLVSDYHELYSYHGGKFLGWHWREYTLAEFVELFRRTGFEIENASHLLSFMEHEVLTSGRKIKRLLGRAAFGIFPSTGSTCALAARKPNRQGQ